MAFVARGVVNIDLPLSEIEIYVDGNRWITALDVILLQLV